MDTSEIYVKMCDKAVEIQLWWKPKLIDAWVHKGMIEICYVWCQETKEGNYEYLNFVSQVGTWLPRQDQLQEMVSDKEASDISNAQTLLNSIYEWVIKSKELHLLGSLEQLWLAFVMKEKYNKTWNGKDWECCDECLTEHDIRHVAERKGEDDENDA